MCHLYCGCHADPHLLPPKRLPQGPTHIRVLRHGSRPRRRHLLLYPALPHQGYIRWLRFPRLPAIEGTRRAASHLPSLRNPRRNSHAALPLPRFRHRPTPPLRLRREIQTLHPHPPTSGTSSSSALPSKNPYHPSLPAIRSSLTYSITELTISLLTFALFVNSALLILAGSSLPASTADASIFAIHSLLASTIAPAAGTIFALALLLSGISAGIVCTIAGQMVSEGALRWTTAPWLRRLITRSISITPSIIIAAAVGKDGLTAALNGSQVALSVALPFVSAPLIYFTCRSRYMTVRPPRPVEPHADDDGDDEAEVVESAVTAGEGPMGAADAKTEGATTVPAVTTTLPPPGGSEAKTNSSPRDREPRVDVADVVEGARVASLDEDADAGVVNFRNGWVTGVFAVLVWLFITVMNVANLVLLGVNGG
ncbi:hypothetical protein GMDG_03382 [Pseudogymnoascus destructans 20631-21]|uniref:Uncharacterized protein n=1 Tax=Pseudogymnoascus destructans (strain ATCC MYA-4855 / 20631-21) TaxID=658429 RepID=L8G629_PSED2|nr:hypothetical protein GMDG_03382 [Pseudogymnoascus destructans 20631-21]